MIENIKVFAETERLILREVLPGDEPGFFELDSDPDVHRYLGNNPIKTIEQARETIAFIRQQYTELGIGRWAVIEKSTDTFIGWCGLKLMKEMINNHINFYDLGYRLIKKHWGKGYATEAASATRDYGFINLKLNELFALAQIENTGSNKVLKKIGFAFTGTVHHYGSLHNWYEMTREERLKKVIHTTHLAL